MRTLVSTVLIAAACLVTPARAESSGAGALPMVAGQPVVATVDGDSITLEDLVSEIARLHSSHGMDQTAARRQNPGAVLERMITAKLISAEAAHSGLGDLPEVKQYLDDKRRDLVRDTLVAMAVAKAGPPTAGEVDAIYKKTVREYRVRSILVPHEADAKGFEAAMKAGGDFDKLATDLVAKKRATEGNASEWLKSEDLQPEIKKLLDQLKVGQVSPLVHLGKAATMFRLLEVRHPEVAEAHARAKSIATEEKRARVIETLAAELRKRFATVDKALLKSIDLEQPGAFEKAKKDRRPLAQIRNGAPVTVADLAAGMEEKFYHGIDKAIAGKKVNQSKGLVLENEINKRVVLVEAAAQGIENSEQFRARLARQREGFLFNAYVQKAIVPDITVNEAEIKAHYEAHRSEMLAPETYALDSIAFKERKDAEEALTKLQRGADLAWMKSRAPGLADPSQAKAVLDLPPTEIAATSLPESLQRVLKGARKGDHRLYSAEGGPHFVIVVKAQEEAKPFPIDMVREGIKRKVNAEKLGKAVEALGAKLRARADIKVHATGEALTRIVMQDLSGA